MIQHGRGTALRDHQDVEKTVVVVVADGDRAGALRASAAETARGGRILEATLSHVPQQLDAAVLARQQEIGVAIAVEIAERRVPAGGTWW